MLIPIRDYLLSHFLPSITAQQELSPLELDVVALPPRKGGLGIQNPCLRAVEAYDASKMLTKPLKDAIIQQQRSSDFPVTEVKKLKTSITKERNIREDLQRKEILQQRTALKKDQKNIFLRCFEAAGEKGASNWLTTPPTLEHNFNLNRRDFYDALCVRYSWWPKNFPQQCLCTARNSVVHALDCKKGGLRIMRHDETRNDLGFLMELGGCKQVIPELQLIPLTSTEETKYGPDSAGRCRTNKKGKMDLTCLGFWGLYQRAFFDIRIFNPSAPTYISQPLEKAKAAQEAEKKEEVRETHPGS